MATAEFSKFAGTLSAALSQHYLSGFEIAQLEFQEVKCKGEKERYTHLNKASGGDGIPIELLQILKDDSVKVLYSICYQIW